MRRIKMKGIGVNISLLFIVVIVFLFISEFTLRSLKVYTLFDKNDDLIKFIQKSDNPKIGFELISNVSGHIYDKEVIINPRGERGKLYPYEKSNKTRILFIGDSITFGYGNLINESYPYIIEKELNAESINLGVFSYNTVQQVESLKENGLKYSPNIVVVGFYISNPEGYYNRLGMNKAKHKIILEKFPLFLQRLLKNSVLVQMSFRTLGSINVKKRDPYLEIYNSSSDDWMRFIEALDELESLSKENNFTTFFIIHPKLYKFEEYTLYKYHQIARKLAEKRGFVVVDIVDYYRSYPPNLLKIARQDNVHPNYFGNKIIASAIAEEVMKAS